MRTCNVDACEGTHYARGYCKKHYARLLTFGDPLHTKGTPHGLTPLERFMRHVTVGAEGECWIWTGTRAGTGQRHGLWREKPGMASVGAHVWIYTAVVGPVPPGMVLDHFECDRPVCVNPAHLRPVTHRENTLRGDSFAAWNAAKTHCVHGHEFTPENTYMHRGKRHCRACRARSWRVAGGRRSRAKPQST